MAKAQTKPIPEETFLNYFGMQRPPFGLPDDPLEIFDCEQYEFLNDRLVSVTEQSGSLAVICGVDGSGKTTLLNRYIANLPEHAAYARFDETCKTGKQFYFEFLTQLGFDEISGTLSEFRNITREFLIYQAAAGKRVLIFLDNAHLVKPSVLEQLRWISSTKIKGRKILSIVLAGNADLPRIMESPAMQSLKSKHRLDFNIRVFTESETDAYVWHCLRASGGADVAKFSNDARAMIYRYTGGIPGQINTLCSAALAEACARENRVIHDKLVRVVADREQMLPHAVPLSNKGRRKYDQPEVSDREADQTAGQEGEIEEIKVPRKKSSKKAGAARKVTTAKIGELRKEVSATKRALTAAKKTSGKLTTELGKEKRAASKAQAQVEKSKAAIEKFEKQVAALQLSVSRLTADLKQANKLVAVTAGLEKDLAKSDEDREALRRKLQELELIEESIAVRDRQIAELETALTLHTSEPMTIPRSTRMNGTTRGAANPTQITDETPSTGENLTVEFLRNGTCQQVLDVGQQQCRVMVGRGDNCDVHLDSRVVSRHHALLSFSRDGVLIEDLNSFNGTTVNGSKITRCRIGPEDTVNIGDYELRTKHT